MNIIDLFRKSLALLPKSDSRKMFFVIGVQLILGLMDLVGVAAFGLLGSLAVRGIQSRSPGDRVAIVLRFLGLQNFSFQNQVAVVGILATVSLVSRTLLSMFLSRKIAFFMSRRSAVLSTNLFRNLIKRDLLFIQKRSSQETLFALTNGTQSVTLGIITTILNLISDSIVLLILTIGIFIVDPISSIVTLVLFTLIATILYFFVNQKANTLGSQVAQLNVSGNENILEVLSSFREIFVRNRQEYYTKLIGENRISLSNKNAELSFIPSISKYVIEITIVFSIVLIGIIQFILKDASNAVATLAVFMAAASRIAPAVLRIQSGLITVKSSSGAAALTLGIVKEIGDIGFESANMAGLSAISFEHDGFVPSIKVKDLHFQYPNSLQETIRGIDFNILEGQFVAIVGPSGSGKSTLIDLLLGILEPACGVVEISHLPVRETVKRWPGAIAYVPQEVQISNSTIFENVGLGYPEQDLPINRVIESLNLSQLSSFISDSEIGLRYQVGERGNKISGGQRQRLGIARALFTKPKLLVLDEATSALDGLTEVNITDEIQALRGRTTIVMIAHRLSTVKRADLVMYMHEGKLISSGTFDQVKSLVPDFAEQARLMGL